MDARAGNLRSLRKLGCERRYGLVAPEHRDGVGFSGVSHFNRLFRARQGKQSSFWRVVTRHTETD
jgi:hypothetical protein